MHIWCGANYLAVETGKIPIFYCRRYLSHLFMDERAALSSPPDFHGNGQENGHFLHRRPDFAFPFSRATERIYLFAADESERTLIRVNSCRCYLWPFHSGHFTANRGRRLQVKPAGAYALLSE